MTHALLLALPVLVGTTAGCDRVGPSPLPEPVVLSVRSIFPSTGSHLVTRVVHIAGTGFEPGATAAVDGVVTDTTFVASHTLRITLAAREPGRVDIVVTNPSGESARAQTGYTYVDMPSAVFTDPISGARTTDVREADGQIVRFVDGHLIWTTGGKVFPGYVVTRGFDGAALIPAAALCKCELEVRFGLDAGERRAYLTADYGHDNPGTLVDLEVTEGALVATRSAVYPPGLHTLFGVATEMTPAGPMPIEGANVYLSFGSGGRATITDRNGLYEIRGLQERAMQLSTAKDGFAKVEATLSLTSSTQFDLQLVRR